MRLPRGRGSRGDNRRTGRHGRTSLVGGADQPGYGGGQPGYGGGQRGYGGRPNYGGRPEYGDQPEYGGRPDYGLSLIRQSA